ncbi:hypothetical protein DPMN_173556 [Dreissena polymorpha]|uniref:Uncharacterized protein n=1 Tax=Dreissena polymorpha TaxID=45954 RepID=A0A9D4IHQ0_DREPO|nr:hypothetical protein DPMN_173556 [Dreissena polymorpha]
MSESGWGKCYYRQYGKLQTTKIATNDAGSYPRRSIIPHNINIPFCRSANWNTENVTEHTIKEHISYHLKYAQTEEESLVERLYLDLEKLFGWKKVVRRLGEGCGEVGRS